MFSLDQWLHRLRPTSNEILERLENLTMSLFGIALRSLLMHHGPLSRQNIPNNPEKTLADRPRLLEGLAVFVNTRPILGQA